MNKFILTSILVASLGATSAQANEVFANQSVTSGLSSVSSEAVQNLETCLRSDIGLASSKAIRACSKSYRDSVPNHGLRSDILTRRGLLQLSAGRFDKASADFKRAAKLSGDNEFAFLGQGFAALLKNDPTKAADLFNDCTAHKKAAPLAIYGLAMASEMSGDMNAAKHHYEMAAKMRPDWSAPRDELNRVTSAG